MNLIATLLTLLAPAQDDQFNDTVRPFLERHCFKCHGPKKAKGKLRLDLAKAEDAKLWETVLEMVTGNEMPPKKEPRPPKQDVTIVTAWINRRLARAGEKVRREGGRMVIRRLNRTEYDNTIRDLFGIDLKPARTFPEDDSAHGFDNVGSALTISSLLFEKYLNAAEWVTARTFHEDRPETKRNHWDGPALIYKPNLVKLQEAGRQPPNNAIALFQIGPQSNNNMNLSTYEIPRGIRADLAYRTPVAGEYIVRVKAYAIGGGVYPGLHRARVFWEPKHLENFPEGKLGVILKVSRNGEMVERIHVSRNPEVYEVRAWAEAGSRFHYNFENGAPNVRGSVDILKNYPGPGLAIEWIEIEGPIYDTWPPPSHRRVFFGDPDAPKDRAYAKAILERFLPRAYRRPAKPGEIADLLTLFDERLKEGDSFEASVSAAIELALCSPNFLYIVEPGENRPLNPYELASRLSYFLWSSMPDEELFRKAADGTLTRDLELQVRRMLKDKKASALTTNFVGQWLKLRKLKTIAVDQRLYPLYSDYLQHLFRRETEAFFDEILHQDLSVLNFIDSDFAMLNDRLALHYGIGGVEGPEFRRVPLKQDGRRGGLTSQASILTLTTCGTRTSPVMRGKWILESMLGVEPPPPPKEVPALTPDTRGTTTIRERLAKHREDPSCARCHDKIDPFGLAMENYNVIGRWRDDYATRGRKARPIDARATTVDGETFNGPGEMRATLMAHKDAFCHGLVAHLLTYALGRGLDLGDRKVVDDLAAALKNNDYTLVPLIVELVKSDPFRRK